MEKIKLFESKDKALQTIEDNSIHTLRIDGKAYCLGRIGTELFAIDDTCTHDGASLSQGEIRNGLVECPWHHYLFNLKTGEQLGGKCPNAKTFPITVDEEGVYLQLPLNPTD